MLALAKDNDRRGEPLAAFVRLSDEAAGISAAC